MRLFAHHRFRESVKRHLADLGSTSAASAASWRPKDLFEDWTKWAPDYFKPGSEHDITRRYFPQLTRRFEFRNRRRTNRST